MTDGKNAKSTRDVAPKDPSLPRARGSKRKLEGDADAIDDAIAPWAVGARPEPTAAREMVRVSANFVAQPTDPATLPDVPDTVDSLLDLASPIARRALALGVQARDSRLHVFVSVDPEIAIDEDVLHFVERRLAEGTRPSPPDIVYVHDFLRPEAPVPLAIPIGTARPVAAIVERLVQRLRLEMPSVREAPEVLRAEEQIGTRLEQKNREVVTGLESRAKNLGFGVKSLQGGIQTYPILHGKPLSVEQFEALDAATKQALGAAEERLTAEVAKAVDRVRTATAKYEARRDEALAKAARSLVEKAVDGAVAEIAGLFSDGTPASTDAARRSPPLALLAWFGAAREALVADWADLVLPEKNDEDEGELDPEHATRLGRFRVNVFVARDPDDFAPPVVYETNPSWPNLFGYLERRAKFGALLTDFTRVRAGALHRASGGVLVLRAADLLTDPILWERTKRALRERKMAPEDPLGPLGLYTTTLRPVPVPLDVKVVLVGTPEMYADLLDADADFASLFRVKVEVDPAVPRTPESIRLLDGYLMGRLSRDEELHELAGKTPVFDAGARAKLLDLAARLAGERDRLSLMLAPLQETGAFARTEVLARATSETITADDVRRAWRERRDRTGLAERHFRTLLLDGTVVVDTDGLRVGCVNGLSVLSTGDVDFGQPVRITAVIALGREGLIDVEREAQLGGAIHTKGIAILRGYLGRLFGQERPLSLRAQIAFEQSYGEIDGDSAACAELFALLSALADVGIDQGIAITGSLNQLGAVQAVGGVCAKIEGFYDLCQARGLTGHQGVMLPRSNVSHLVLREDVAEAVAAGKFHLYAIDNVAQGVAVLTGLPAGERDGNGRFPASSVFGRVERRIIEIAERLREAEAPARLPAPPDSTAELPPQDMDRRGDGSEPRGWAPPTVGRGR